MAGDDSMSQWLSLPRRIYLDTSTLQTISDFDEAIFENLEIVASGRAARVDGIEREVEALRLILLVNDRAGFEFVITSANFAEVVEKRELPYTQWVREVARTWEVQSEFEPLPMPGAQLEHRRFGMLSKKDRRLLQDALDWRCDAFLTMERKLPRNAEFIERETGLRVLRPTDYWGLLAKWAPLYR